MTAPHDRTGGPQLICYADRLAGDLRGVAELLRGPLDGAFTGVHLLPFFFPIDGADAGFDPIDHTMVDPRLGTWAEIAELGSTHPVMADLIVNHVSDQSAAFRDWIERQRDSDHDGMFLTFDTVFPDGALETDLAALFRPRPGLPFTRLPSGTGQARMLWTTFTSHQIDIDVEHPTGWAYLEDTFDQFAQHGVRMVRLDAVGYAVKRAGTSCFMLPETFEFIDQLTDALHRRGLTVLVEIHAHYRTQIEIAGHVDLVYDFALPPLLLDALFHGRADALEDWLRIRPANAITVLDTHDGIGVMDIAADGASPDRPGLLPRERINALVEEIHRRSRGTSQLATGAAASNLDLYQVNCTYYDALGADDQGYLIARLIQCLVPGVPQVYYVGLLAGGNDVELLRATGVGRDVNRHRYSTAEITEELRRPVVRQLLALLRWRARCDVFAGAFSVISSPVEELHLRWDHPGGRSESVEARIDLAAASFELTESGPSGTRRRRSFEEF